MYTRKRKLVTVEVPINVNEKFVYSTMPGGNIRYMYVYTFIYLFYYVKFGIVNKAATKDADI